VDRRGGFRLSIKEATEQKPAEETAAVTTPDAE